jgi:hypothetical protein
MELYWALISTEMFLRQCISKEMTVQDTIILLVNLEVENRCILVLWQDKMFGMEIDYVLLIPMVIL